MVYDVIVCGAGVVGLWTANHLAEQKKNVLLLEQFPFPHSRGSSHGPSRITRYSYVTSHHSKMMFDAFELWSKLEKLQKLQLFVNCGILSIFSDKKIAALTKSLDEINKEYQVLSEKEISTRFPGIANLALSGVFENTGGILKASKCIESLRKNLLGLGGNMLDERKVELIKPINDELVEVVTNNGTYFSKSVVLTCGSWINKVLKPLNLQLPIKSHKVSVEYWKARNPSLYDVKSFPALRLRGMGVKMYSTPILEYPGLMKVCQHAGVDADPDNPDQSDPEQAEINRQRLSSMVNLCFPNLIPERALIETCFYTETPDRDFILDRHPQHPNIIIGAGFSGHGFKISPVVGEILSDLATGKNPKHDVTPFSLNRFKPKSSL